MMMMIMMMELMVTTMMDDDDDDDDYARISELAESRIWFSKLSRVLLVHRIEMAE